MVASVSVVIPCYKCSDTVNRTVDSVLAQTLPPTEIILVDDYSGDNTSKVLLDLQSQHGHDRIKVIALNSNGGPAVARNTGWDAATSDYVAFLDADDGWHPEKVNIHYSWMVRNPDLVISSSLCKVCALNEQAEAYQFRFNSQALPYKFITKRQVLYANSFITSGIMVKRNINIRLNSSKRYSEDALLWIDIVLNGGKAAVLMLPLVYRYRPFFSKGGAGGNLWKMEVGELDNFRLIWQAGQIDSLEMFTASTWSFAKYIRRACLRAVRDGL
jgi:glycosyltransferase involved in cell wall biosynthesis